ncbi:MAG: hypothetical protein ACI37Z_09375 [Candidatus Gastranaerophilaceae bacterium]
MQDKYIVTLFCYDKPGTKKYIHHPGRKDFHSYEDAVEFVQKMASSEYYDLISDCDNPDLFDLDFDGPYEAVVRLYSELPTEGDKDYVNITEYYITRVSEENDNTCVAAYIDRRNIQTLNFIRLRLEEGTISYIVEEADREAARGKFTSEKEYKTAVSAIPDFIEYYYGKTPVFENGKCEDLEILDVPKELPSYFDMAMIRMLSRKQYQPEDLYVFEILLCDNEIDVDYEKFSYEALLQLKEKYVGKSGGNSKHKARIFQTYIENDLNRKTVNGETYACLKAKAYMLNNAENKPFIELLQKGDKKQVSLSCSVRTRTCSICGKENCEHIHNKIYNGKTCFSVIDDIADVYEFFF